MSRAVKDDQALAVAHSQNVPRVMSVAGGELEDIRLGLGRRKIEPMHPPFLAEELLCLLKKAFATGIDVWIAERGELLEFGALCSIEMLGHFHLDPHMQIARAVALHVMDTFAFEAKDGAALRAGWDFDVGFAS